MHGTGHHTFCAAGMLRCSWKQAKWTLFNGAAMSISCGGVSSGGCSSLDTSSRGVPVPSGVGMKSSSGVTSSSSSTGGGERVTGGGDWGEKCD